MTILEAAHAVLSSAEGPLHYRDIARRAVDRGLLTGAGAFRRSGR
jgi:hypothetical protein